MSLQEDTFTGDDEAIVPPETHPLLERLRKRLADDEEYGRFSKVLRRMLHPDVQKRAKIEEILAAEL